MSRIGLYEFQFCSFRAINIVTERSIIWLKKTTNYTEQNFKFKTQEVGLLICLWKNRYVDKTVDITTFVDKMRKKYNITIENIAWVKE